MKKEGQTLDYAPVSPNTRRVSTSTMLAAYGVAFHILVFAVLTIAGAYAKSDWWMRIFFCLLAVGPPHALFVLTSTFLEVRRERKWIAAVAPVILIVLMMAMWLSLFSGYVTVKHDIETVRARVMQQMQQQASGQP